MLREGRTVLEIVRLQVARGEVLAVIGPNGAGKSTLLLALSRLIKPDRGKLMFDGQEVRPKDDLAYRRRIGLVLQEPLLLDVSVFDNVATGLRYRGLSRQEVQQRVDLWLEQLGITHLRKRPASRLSGGEAQRVSLARAFALEPQMILLDEPFSALDAPTRARLLLDFQALLANTQITTVFVTHDLDEALFLGHRVAVLLQGHIRQTGPPNKVFSAPADREVATFVGVETVIEGRVTQSYDGRVFIQANGFMLEAVGETNPGKLVLLCLRPEDITLWPQDPASQRDSPLSSARNRLHGRIQRMLPQGPLVRVVIDCGFPLVALITRASLQEMEIAEGSPVVATFKASAVHMIVR